MPDNKFSCLTTDIRAVYLHEMSCPSLIIQNYCPSTHTVGVQRKLIVIQNSNKNSFFGYLSLSNGTKKELWTGYIILYTSPCSHDNLEGRGVIEIRTLGYEQIFLDFASYKLRYLNIHNHLKKL